MTKAKKKKSSNTSGTGAAQKMPLSRVRWLILIGVTVLITLILMASITPKRYDLYVGMVPNVTIQATKDIVDEYTTNKRRDEAARAVAPVTVYQEGVMERVLEKLDTVFNQIRTLKQHTDQYKNISSFRIFTTAELNEARALLPSLDLKDYQMTTLIRTPAADLENLYTYMYASVQNVMSSQFSKNEVSGKISSILQLLGFSVDPTVLQNVATPILESLIEPNLLEDTELTEAARQAAREGVDPVVYKQGQNIVVKGEGSITQSQYDMLAALGLLTTQSADFNPYLGGILASILSLTIFFAAVNRLDPHTLQRTQKLLLLSIILVFSFAVCVVAKLINTYLMPLLLCCMLATTLVTARSALAGNVLIAVLAAALTAGSSEAYTDQAVLILISTLVSGSFIVLFLARNKSSRLLAILGGVLAALLDVAVFAAFGLMTANDLTGTLNNALWRAAGTMISAFLYMGVQPLLELIFNLPTNYKLLELANPNRPLLRRLLLEAPGTYHHSIIVANLAEAAAEAIGANPLLARAGGYYHDIGKLKRPLYFKENQMSGFNPHDQTDPATSASIVTSHVSDGVCMAKEAHLPAEIIRIISEHHGDTPVMYFYHKALQQANGMPVDINAFRYSGNPPTTRESAIIMLCDTIEAAVRTLKNPTPENIENYIVKLVRGKLEDGQLSNSDLTLKDIDLICSACTQVLVGVFHERIEYPRVPQQPIRTSQDRNAARKEPEAVQPAGAAPPKAADEAAASMVIPEPEPEPVRIVEPAAETPVPVVDPEELLMTAASPYVASATSPNVMPEDSVPEPSDAHRHAPPASEGGKPV